MMGEDSKSELRPAGETVQVMLSDEQATSYGEGDVADRARGAASARVASQVAE